MDLKNEAPRNQLLWVSSFQLLSHIILHFFCHVILPCVRINISNWRNCCGNNARRENHRLNWNWRRLVPRGRSRREADAAPEKGLILQKVWQEVALQQLTQWMMAWEESWILKAFVIASELYILYIRTFLQAQVARCETIQSIEL